MRNWSENANLYIVLPVYDRDRLKSTENMGGSIMMVQSPKRTPQRQRERERDRGNRERSEREEEEMSTFLITWRVSVGGCRRSCDFLLEDERECVDTIIFLHLACILYWLLNLG